MPLTIFLPSSSPLQMISIRTIFALLIPASISLAALAEVSDIPRVALSEQHRAMCKVGVGDKMPPLALQTPNGDVQKLAPLAGKVATVVVFYQGEGWMTKSLLRDLPRDVAEQFGKKGVQAITIAVGRKPELVKGMVSLSDPDGKALAQVGTGKLPRVYVLSAEGKILWFDIEYSHSTRRELRATLQHLVGAES